MFHHNKIINSINNMPDLITQTISECESGYNKLKEKIHLISESLSEVITLNKDTNKAINKILKDILLTADMCTETKNSEN